MGDKSLVYSEIIKVPLFNKFFTVYVGYDVEALQKHVENMFIGLELGDLQLSDKNSFTYMVKHYESGDNLFVLISLGTTRAKEEINVIHEAVRLSWYILEDMKIKVGLEDHQVQCYLVSHIVKSLKTAIKKGKHNLDNNYLGDL